MFFGKHKLMHDGLEARALVLDKSIYEYLDPSNTPVGVHYQVRVTFDDMTSLEVQVGAHGATACSFTVGDIVPVRYDPSDRTKVVLDRPAIEAQAAAAESDARSSLLNRGELEMLLPPDLKANGILGRGVLLAADKTPGGATVRCKLTFDVLLIDGTEEYTAICEAALSPEWAKKAQPNSWVVTLRADPKDRQRIALALLEDTPDVTVTDPWWTDPPARALREGVPCRIEIIESHHQNIRMPNGDDLRFAAVRVLDDSSVLKLHSLVVPDDRIPLMQTGAQFPAKRVVGDEQALAIDWEAVPH